MVENCSRQITKRSQEVLCFRSPPLGLTQLSQLRTSFSFFVMIFVLKSCVFIVGI
jgi:hypothetical protein